MGRDGTTRPRSRSSRGMPKTGGLFRDGELLAGTFEVRAVLGSGGMGQVYDAHDRVLNRRVAIKAHWPHLRAFPIQKEAQALAAIRHPSVVTVHSVGRHRDIDFIVMERILGATLADHIDKRRAAGPFPIDEAIDILARLAEGLRAVHEAGIAHRDVKPGNVMLAPRERLVLTDFGIFQPQFDVVDGDVAPGTADYMAPEAISRRVARGEAHLVDVYAFGILAFEMLAGRRPFEGDSVMAIVGKQLYESPPPIASVRRDTPAHVAAIVDAALHKDPGERPATMELVLAGLRARAPERPSKRPLSVLIAEDEPAMASVLEELISDVAPDADVRVARDGNAVLAHVRQSQPDLMLLDLGLPSMNGVELCMHLRGNGMAERTSIVALSAAAQPNDVALLRQLGVRSFIRKGGDWLDRVEAAVLGTRSTHI